MQYQKMPTREGQFEIGDLRQAKKCTATDVRFVLQKRKLRSLPKGIENIKHLPRVELDLSYNRALPHDQVFQDLVDYPNVKGLGLIKHEMGTLPDSIGLLPQLEVLDLWSNELRELPKSFANLVNLEFLNFRNNKITEIPEYFKNFTKLKELNLRFNKVKKLPKPLLALTQLEHLDLTSTGLSELSEDISVFKNLRVLVLEKNKLQKLPESLAQLKKLERVELKGNKNLDWKQVFGVLKQLPKIKELNFKEWGLTELPEEIGEMKQLEKLDLQYNKLKSLPASIASLPNLEIIEINENPWEVKEVFPVLSQVKAYKRLEYYSFKAEWPEGNYEFPYLEEIHLSGYPYKTLPDWIGKIETLKGLYISRSNSLESIPDLSGLTALETLSIYSNELLEIETNSLIQVSQVENLLVTNNKNAFDFKQVKQFKNLKKLSLPDIETTTFGHCKDLPHLEEIYLPRIERRAPNNLPDEFFTLTQLKKVNLYGITSEHIERILINLKSFQRLENLMMNAPIETKFLVETVQGHQHLKELAAQLNYPITEEFGDLKQLKNLETFHLSVAGLGWQARDSFVLPNSYFGFPKGVLKNRNYQSKIDEHDKFIERARSWNLNDKEKEQIFYMLWKKDFNGIEAFVKSPFDAEGKLDGETIFIVGRPSHGTLKELETKLKDRGAKVSKKWKDDITYVLLTPNIKEKNWEILVGKSGYEFMLEDQLKDQAIAEDTPYLMEEGNEGLTEQITNLLKAKEDDQISLILELIEGGGANKTLLSYLGAIHLFHFDNEVRKKSRKLFRKFASSKLQAHIKKTWKASFKDKAFDIWKVSIQSEEIDTAAFIHAYKMVKWYEIKSGKVKQNYHNLPQNHGRLILNLGDKFSLSDAVKDWEWINSLNITSKNPIDLDWLYEMLKDTGIQNIQLRISIKNFPTKLISIPSLESFAIYKFYDAHSPNDNNSISIKEPVKGNIKSISIRHVDLENAYHLSSLNQLESLDVLSCQIGDANFISKFQHLKKLSLIECNLNVLPKSFEQLSQLENLNVSKNQIEEVDLNFSAFQNLKQFAIANSSLRKISDTFDGCEALDQVYLNENNLSVLPSSFFKINSKYNHPQLRIFAQKNKIESIAPIKKHVASNYRPYIREVRLDENQLTEFPSIFFEIIPVQSINLNGNPIKELPAAVQDLDANMISFSAKEMKVIPAFIFKGKVNYSIDIQNQNIQLPSKEEIPQHNKYFRFYTHSRSWKDAEDDIKRINDFIQYVEKQKVQ